MSTNLGRMMVLYRASRDVGVRTTAEEIGTSAATLSRVERGHQPDLKTWRKIEAWLLRVTAERESLSRSGTRIERV